MPLVAAYPIRTKTVSFLWDMVTAEVAASRSYDSDWQADVLYQQIIEKLKIPEDFRPYVDSFATAVAYTQKLTFLWRDGTPPEIRALEAVWQSIMHGADIVECFSQFRAADITVLNGAGNDPDKLGYVKGWRRAVSEGYQIWTPPEMTVPEKLTEKELSDPN